MDPHERATSCWYRVAGLLRRKELAIEIVEAEIRSAQHEVLLEAAKLVLIDAKPIEIARQLRDARSGRSDRNRAGIELARGASPRGPQSARPMLISAVALEVR